MLARNSLNFCCKVATNQNLFYSTVLVLSKHGKVNRSQSTTVKDHQKHSTTDFPSQADVVIIGGGAMGSSTAYWLKEKSRKHALKVVVVEKDPTYSDCSTSRSVGGLRQQFSLKENIQLSLYGAEFMDTLKERFGPDADVNFSPRGYLVLASEQGADHLTKNWKLQKELGAVNVLLGKEELRKRFPWMNVSDLEIGCLGLEKEGWFDPWMMLSLLKSTARDLGAQYVHCELTDFQFKGQCNTDKNAEDRCSNEISSVVVKLPSGELKTIECKHCVITAGPQSGEVAKLARIGTGSGMLSVPLPVEKRKRYVFRFMCPKGAPDLQSPMLIDNTGTYVRRDGPGGAFICGLSPKADEEPSTEDMEVDYGWFDEKLWPNLANRVEAFGCLKVASAWSGFYEYNSFDQNGVIGRHPSYENLYIASGFSGHGIQQSPAVGRSIAELILDGSFQTIDLTRLGFSRLIENKPLREVEII